MPFAGDPFRSMTKALASAEVPPERLHSLQLAYLGDAVFELAVRSALGTRQDVKVKELHRMTTDRVRAGAQARMLRHVAERLRPDEAEIVRRARNAKSSVPRNVQMGDYRHSTAFEALLGYLYLKGETERLVELIEAALASIDEE